METVIALGKHINKPPISIEIIPGDGSELVSAFGSSSAVQGPFLFIDDNLGVPQKILYHAYMTCTPVFARLRKLFHQDWKEIASRQAPPEWVDELRHVSAVILLGNPAHQTALNVRKRLVQIGVLHADRELQVARAMLTVRECSKQAIWWRYRRWLLRSTHSPIHQSPAEIHSGGSMPPGTPDTEEDSICNVAIPPKVIRDEFDIISRACEIYPRNYHAWIHRYYCLQALDNLTQTAAQSALYNQLLYDETNAMQMWIERHISDYTAVQYICQAYDVLKRIRNRENKSVVHLSPGTRLSSPSEPAPLYKHSITLLVAYPAHETLWYYLRNGVTVDGRDTVQKEAISYARECLLERLKTNVLHTADSDEIFRNTCRLLAWFARQERGLHTDEVFVRRVMKADTNDTEIANILLRATELETPTHAYVQS